MDKSIILNEDVKAYFTSHAALAARGRKVTKLKVFEPIAQTVKIAQKRVKYRPSEKLLDAFISLLAGAQAEIPAQGSSARRKANLLTSSSFYSS